MPGFWQTIEGGEDLPSTVPLQRWDIDEYYSPEGRSKQLSMYVRLAAFVDKLDNFDAEIFRQARAISPDRKQAAEHTSLQDMAQIKIAQIQSAHKCSSPGKEQSLLLHTWHDQVVRKLSFCINLMLA